jgi:hypothetical protein
VVGNKGQPLISRTRPKFTEQGCQGWTVMDEADQTEQGGLGRHPLLPSPPVFLLMRKLVVSPSCFARRALDFESRAKTPLSGCIRGMERQLWNRQGNVATAHDKPVLGLSGVELHLT